MTAPTAVAPVRAALGDVLLPTQVRTAGSAVAGGHVYLDVIDKIAFCHGLVCFFVRGAKVLFFPLRHMFRVKARTSLESQKNSLAMIRRMV